MLDTALRSLARSAALTLVALTGLLSLAEPTAAHRPSDAYLNLTLNAEHLDGRWDLALRDLEHALGLDSDRDGAITWGELKARHDDLAAYALSRLALTRGGTSCVTAARDHLIERRGDGTYAVLLFSADCPKPEDPLVVRYDLFFDLDPTHRGLARLDKGGDTQSFVFAPEQHTWQVADAASLAATMLAYLREGIWHILIGLDHVLFLITLLLPTVVRRHGGRWQAVASPREASLETLKLITAFTLAHSVTLSLAVLGWVTLPAQPVEAVIAASVVAAALNNIFPIVQRGLWIAAFGFGLVHGFGFAGVLGELGLPTAALVPALISFNVGVEVGQLAIVAVLLPMAFMLRRTTFYPRVALQAGSLLIAAIGSVWLVERSLLS